MPLVSIIIPAYNAEDWISDTIQSVIEQKHEDWEAIVVNDGSSDNTEARVKDIQDTRVKLINQPNQGAAAARNNGFNRCNGEYIQYLDADDLLLPDKISSQLAQRDDNDRTLYSGAWAHYRGPDSAINFHPDPIWCNADPIDWLVLSLGGGGMMHPNCWLTPRSLIKEAGPWKNDLSLHDDGEFFTRVILKASDIKFVREAEVYYRDVSNSLSRQRSHAAATSALKVCQSMETALLSVENSNRTRKALAHRYAQVAYEFTNSYPDIAQKALMAFRQLDPRSKPEFGSESFRKLTHLLGFPMALKVRRWSCRLKP